MIFHSYATGGYQDLVSFHGIPTLTHWNTAGHFVDDYVELVRALEMRMERSQMAAYEGVELANMPFTVGMRMFIVFMVFVRISFSRRISHVFRSFRVGFLLILHDPP